MNDDFAILDLDHVEAVIEPFDWRFNREYAEEIEAIWQREVTERPRLFNGKVLIQHRGETRGRVFHAGYSQADYKPFLAWHRLGHPPPHVRNGFAMAALRAQDGAFLLGEMAQHTANAGKIYFAAGTPDLDDVKDGLVDLEGSVTRELFEETGLGAGDVCVGAGWTAVLSPIRVAFMRAVSIALPAQEARALMLSRMSGIEEDELVDIHIVRTAADIDETRMPPFQIAFLRHALAG